MLEYIAFTEGRRRRGENQDRVFVNNRVLKDGCITGKDLNVIAAVVCDGVSGTHGGDIAAQMTAASFRGINVGESSGRRIAAHLRKVNKRILLRQDESEIRRDMASTVAGLFIYGSTYMAFNLGDSRVYEFYEEKLNLCTRDHIIKIPKEDGGEDYALTGYLGYNKGIRSPTIKRGNIRAGSQFFLLCSDGVYKNIKEEDMVRILKNRDTLKEKKEAIVQLCLQNGFPDDMSLIIIRSVS